MRWSRRIGRDQKMCVLLGRPATRRSGRSFELRMLIGCYGPRPAGNATFSCLGSRPAANAIEQPIHQEKLPRAAASSATNIMIGARRSGRKDASAFPNFGERPALRRQGTKGNRNPVFSENSQRIASHPQPAYSVGCQSPYTTHHPEGTCVPFLAD